MASSAPQEYPTRVGNEPEFVDELPRSATGFPRDGRGVVRLRLSASALVVGVDAIVLRQLQHLRIQIVVMRAGAAVQQQQRRGGGRAVDAVEEGGRGGDGHLRGGSNDGGWTHGSWDDGSWTHGGWGNGRWTYGEPRHHGSWNYATDAREVSATCASAGEGA